MQTFAGMAPDAALVQGLTKSYVQEPGWRAAVDVATNTPPDPNTSVEVAERTQQAKAIVSGDAAIREYMKALGALAGDSVVQSSSNVNDLKAGLTAWQKDRPSLGITDTQVTLATEIVQAAADLAEAAWRNANLAATIGKYDAPFQTLLDLQITIIDEGVKPSIAEYPRTISSKQRFLRNAAQPVHYLMNRDLSGDEQAADVQLAAADAYVKALKDIKTAHSTLYNNRDKIMTKEMFDQIKGPAQEAYKAFQDYQAAAAKTPTKS